MRPGRVARSAPSLLVCHAALSRAKAVLSRSSALNPLARSRAAASVSLALVCEESAEHSYTHVDKLRCVTENVPEVTEGHQEDCCTENLSA